MLFEADYAKNYASIMYQCLVSDKPVQRSARDEFHILWLPWQRTEKKATKWPLCAANRAVETEHPML